MPRFKPEALREYREAAGATRPPIASLVGCSTQTLWRWETGRTTPNVDQLIALADVLSVSVDDLVERSV
jgi:transcriptional regulator with XRE-family HTH domain